MKHAISKYVLFLVLGIVSLHSGRAIAQLDSTFHNIFYEILHNRLQFSPGAHGDHFLLAAQKADSLLAPALGTMIASNIASFPISSTIAGIAYDFSTGKPVPISQGLGPIFTEIGETFGKGRLLIGTNISNMSFAQYRGIRTEDMRFAFTHEDLTPDDTLGNDPSESDYIETTLDLHVRATIAAIYATYGVTDRLDIGVALPIVNIRLNGNSLSTMSSYTFPAGGSALHFFGGDRYHPILTTAVAFDEQYTGIGDASIRAKYAFVRGKGADFAAMVDVRVPTGSKENYVGTGKTGVRIYVIGSKKIGDFRPHVNLGYENSGTDNISSKFLGALGFDQKLLSNLTLAVDVLASVDLESSKAIKLYPGSVTLHNQSPYDPTNEYHQIVQNSNVPDRNQDNMYTGSFGLRYSISEKFMMMANALVALNDGGLRATVIPTLGFDFYF